MLQSSTAHWCELRIGAASGQAGPEIWPSRTHAQTGKRLAGYGDFSPTVLGLPLLDLLKLQRHTDRRADKINVGENLSCPSHFVVRIELEIGKASSRYCL